MSAGPPLTDAGEPPLTVMALRRRVAAEVGKLLSGVGATLLPSPDHRDCSRAQGTSVRGARTVSESGILQNDLLEGPFLASRKVKRRLVEAPGDGVGHSSQRWVFALTLLRPVLRRVTWSSYVRGSAVLSDRVASLRTPMIDCEERPDRGGVQCGMRPDRKPTTRARSIPVHLKVFGPEAGLVGPDI